MDRNKILVILSGGQDSTTCLFAAKHGLIGIGRDDDPPNWEVHALTFNYGQRHDIEIQAADKVAALAHVASHEFIDLSSCYALRRDYKDTKAGLFREDNNILRSTSPLVSDAPLEQYESPYALPGGVEKTFVPMRNALFLTIAANRAVELGCRWIVIGVSQEDFGGYPDCRREFLVAAYNMIQAGLPGTAIPVIQAPLLNMTKAESILFALQIPDCFYALAWTHTAYDGQFPPTGADHATLLREKGFLEADLPDPLILRAVDMQRMAMPKTRNYRDERVRYVRDMFFPKNPGW